MRHNAGHPNVYHPVQLSISMPLAREKLENSHATSHERKHARGYRKYDVGSF